MKLTPKQKEGIVKGARISQATPTDFWQQVEKRMEIRDKAAKVNPRRLKD